MSSSFDKLVQIMARLRGPNGCPWDHEQTHESIVPQLIEEAHEVISAIDHKNYPHLCEELGDLLLHILFHSQMASERGDFTIDNVVHGLTEKLIRRHPHVFGDTTVKDSSEVMKNWDDIKNLEKKNDPSESILDSVPKSLPALFQAYKLSKKASKVGFDWKKTEDVIPKIYEEIRELEVEIGNKNVTGQEHEIGDLFFALANLCRFMKIQPEEALRKSNIRFRNRFLLMEKAIHQDGREMPSLSLEEWDQFWTQAKKQL